MTVSYTFYSWFDKEPDNYVPDKLKVGESVFPLTLNPFNIKRDIEYRLAGLVFEKLIKFDWHSDVVNVLCHEYKYVGYNNNNAWLFSIDEKARWSDNSPVTNLDLLYTFKRIGCSRHRYATIFKQSNFELNNNNAVLITLPQSINRSFENIQYFTIPVIKDNTLEQCNQSKHLMSESRHFFSTGLKNIFIGTGPYIFDAYDEATGKILFIENLNYYRNRHKNSFKGIEVLILINEFKLAKDGFSNLRGKNKPYLDIDPTVPFSFLKYMPNNVRTFSNITNEVFLIGFNYNDTPGNPRTLFNSKFFRMALIRGIKVSKILKQSTFQYYSGYLKPRSGPLGKDDSIKNVMHEDLYVYDDTKAKNCLEKCASTWSGFDYNKKNKQLKYMGKQFEYTLIYPKWLPDAQPVVEEIKLQLKSTIGLSIKLKGCLQNNWKSIIENRDFDLIYTSIHLGREKNFFPYFTSDHSNAFQDSLNIFSYPHNTQLQTIYQDYLNSNITAKTSLLAQAHNALREDAAAIFLWKRYYLGIKREDIYTGKDNKLEARNLYENVNEWHLHSKN